MSINIPRLPYPEDKMFGLLWFLSLIVPLAFSVFNYESFEIIKFGFLLLLTGGALMAGFGKRSPWPRILRGNRVLIFSLGLFWIWALIASLFAWDKNYSFF